MATTAEGRDWFDGGMEMPGDSVCGHVGSGQNRKSIKSVRWGDETEPRVFELARAL
jgi:hypothetical protein